MIWMIKTREAWWWWIWWIEEVMWKTRDSFCCFFCFWNVFGFWTFMMFLDFFEVLQCFWVLKFYAFFVFWKFYVVFGFFRNITCKSYNELYTRKFLMVYPLQLGRVSKTQECQTHQQSYKVLTRIYKLS